MHFCRAHYEKWMAKTIKIQIKRVYDPFSNDDGLRVLVDRLWPRGLKKANARIAKVLAPTTPLRKWFVMIKDAKGRFAGNPLWGEGWGWALYKPDNKSTNISTDYKADCLGCHIPAKNKDWVYVEAYPTLQKK